MDNEIDEFLKQNEVCFDRFTFDKIMRFLLANDYSHEEAKDTILFHCSLSTLVFQERIYNNYYETIDTEETISKDLLALKNDMHNNILKEKINKIL